MKTPIDHEFAELARISARMDREAAQRASRAPMAQIETLAETLAFVAEFARQVRARPAIARGLPGGCGPRARNPRDAQRRFRSRYPRALVRVSIRALIFYRENSHPLFLPAPQSRTGAGPPVSPVLEVLCVLLVTGAVFALFVVYLPQ
jgi:hypothetical protein